MDYKLIHMQNASEGQLPHIRGKKARTSDLKNSANQTLWSSHTDMQWKRTTKYLVVVFQE